MSGADVVVVVPVLGRPHRVAPLVASLEAATEPGSYRLLFVCTDSDVDEIAAVDAAGIERITIPANAHGDYARKVHAAIRASSEPHIFTGADDLDFHPGWLPAALARMSDQVGVVGTNDLHNPRVLEGRHATHFLVARWYVERFGTIDDSGLLFHEGYWHECVDDELVGTAKHHGAWAFAEDSIVEHLHPNWGLAPTDRIYDEQARRIRFGRRLYWRREQLWR